MFGGGVNVFVHPFYFLMFNTKSTYIVGCTPMKCNEFVSRYV